MTSAIVSVAVYGNLAQGHERPASDIDLLVLVRLEAVKRLSTARLTAWQSR